MTPMQTVLNNLYEFENLLERFCRDLRDRTQDDFVRLIVHQIAAAQRRVTRARANFSSTDPAQFNAGSLTNTDVELLVERIFARSFVSSNSGKDELIDTAVEILDVMNSYDEWLLSQPIGKPAVDFLGKILTEQKDQIERLGELKKSAS
jgi:hypothetical protein